MPIHASAVGEPLAEREIEVSARQLLAFAAGVGEVGDLFLDDARPDGCLGVPAFCVSLEWPVVRATASGNPFGATAEEVLRGVHASQDSTFHRPIRAGDRLRVTGQIASIRPTRAGALVLNKIVTADALTGEPVVTSWYGSIFRGIDVLGEAEPVEVPPPFPVFESREGSGDRLGGDSASRPSGTPPQTADNGGFAASGASALSAAVRVSVPIAREAPHVYSECADIWNPIHTERRVALAAGLPDIILHGTASWALAAREIVRHRCDGDPLRLRRLYGRFAAMVIPGSCIEVQIGGLREGADAIQFEVHNAAGELAVAQGGAVFR